MRRRLILFLVIFGISLTLLAIFVQGDDLLREYTTQTISAQDVGSGAEMINIPSGANEFRLDKRVESIEMPIGEDKTYLDAEGRQQTYKTAIVILPDTELFEDSIHSVKPLLNVYGEGPEHLSAQVRSDLATIYTHSPVDFTALERDDMPEVKSVFLTGNVIAEIFKTDTDPGLELRTEELELDVPPGWDGESGLPPVECPRPLEIRRKDDSLILRGSSGEFDAAGRRVVIHPPVEVIAQVDGLGARFDRLVERGVAERSALIVHADGDLEYTWTSIEDGAEGGAEGDSGDTGDDSNRPADLGRSIGDGEITLRDAVHAEQGEQWMRSEFLRIVIVREAEASPAAAPQEGAASPDPETRARYRVSELEAYDHRGSEPVQFGLLSGTGSTGKLHVREGESTVDFLDHAHFEGLSIGEGVDRTVLELVEASERLSLQRIQTEGQPDRIQLRLAGAARVDVRDRVLAQAEEIDLDLVGRPVPDPDHREPDPPRDEAAPDQAEPDASKQWTPSWLELRGAASLALKQEGDLGGTATADRIVFREDPGGRRHVNLDGSSHCILDGSTLDGPLRHADVKAPSMQWSWMQPEESSGAAPRPDASARIAALDFQLEVPEMTEARFELEGLSMDQLGSLEGGRRETPAPPPAQETDLLTVLEVFPEARCQLKADPDEVHLLGRCELRSLRNEVLLQSLRADRFDARFPSELEREVEARGAVEVYSPADGATLWGDRVEFGEILLAEGAPAVLELRFDPQLAPVVLEGNELRFDPRSGEMRAHSRGGELVHLSGPADQLAQAVREPQDPELEMAEPANQQPTDPAGEPAAGLDPPKPSSQAELWCRELIALRRPEPATEAEGAAEGHAAEEEAPSPDGGPAAKVDQLPFSELLAEGSVRLLQDDGTELQGDRAEVRTEAQSVWITGTPALLLRTPPGAAAPDERAEAEWLELRMVDEVPVLRIAPLAVLEFFLPASKLHDELAEGEGPDALRRVQVLTQEVTVLEGATLSTEGGIELVVHLRDDQIRASSERLEVQFDRSPLTGGVPVQAYARRNVHLQHPWFECRGAVLSFDFVDEWLELRSGIERCQVIGKAEFLPLQVEGMDASFRTLKCRLRSPSGPQPRLTLQELFVEQLTLRPRAQGLGEETAIDLAETVTAGGGTP